MNVWFIAGISLVAAAAGFTMGSKLKQGEWDADKVKQQQDYAARLSDYAQQVEALRAQDKERTATYETRLRTVDTQRNAALASLRNRAERADLPASGAGAEACQGSTGRELSRPDAAFLVWLASRADELRAALERCQGGDVAMEGGRMDR